MPMGGYHLVGNWRGHLASKKSHGDAAKEDVSRQPDIGASFMHMRL